MPCLPRRLSSQRRLLNTGPNSSSCYYTLSSEPEIQIRKVRFLPEAGQLPLTLSLSGGDSYGLWKDRENWQLSPSPERNWDELLSVLCNRLSQIHQAVRHCCVTSQKIPAKRGVWLGRRMWAILQSPEGALRENCWIALSRYHQAIPSGYWIPWYWDPESPLKNRECKQGGPLHSTVWPCPKHSDASPSHAMSYWPSVPQRRTSASISQALSFLLAGITLLACGCRVSKSLEARTFDGWYLRPSTTTMSCSSLDCATLTRILSPATQFHPLQSRHISQPMTQSWPMSGESTDETIKREYVPSPDPLMQRWSRSHQSTPPPTPGRHPAAGPEDLQQVAEHQPV